MAENICKCGCGRIVKCKSCDYVQGHNPNSRGNGFKKDVKQNFIVWNKNLHGKEYLKHFENEITWQTGLNKNTHPSLMDVSNRMKKNNPMKNIECKNKVSENQKGKHNSPKTEWKKNHVPYIKGKTKELCESVKRISESKKGKSRSENLKRKLRIANIKRREQQFNNGLPMHPTIGKHETLFLNHLEKIYNIKFQRQYLIDGYYLDGYCIEKNIAIEIDEKIHYRNGRLGERDIQRQNYIQRKLKCEFIRISDTYTDLMNKRRVI